MDCCDRCSIVATVHHNTGGPSQGVASSRSLAEEVDAGGSKFIEGEFAQPRSQSSPFVRSQRSCLQEENIALVALSDFRSEFSHQSAVVLPQRFAGDQPQSPRWILPVEVEDGEGRQVGPPLVCVMGEERALGGPMSEQFRLLLVVGTCIGFQINGFRLDAGIAFACDSCAAVGRTNLKNNVHKYYQY